MSLNPDLQQFLHFLNRHRELRTRLPAPLDRTVVYSGAMPSADGLHAAWRMLAQAKAAEPARFDYVTLEERLRQFHVVEMGESLYEHANRLSELLKRSGAEDQRLILWRALSGIYVQGARGKVRALILPTNGIARSIFNLTEVSVLLRADVLQQISIDPELLRNFRLLVKSGVSPGPIVVM